MSDSSLPARRALLGAGAVAGAGALAAGLSGCSTTNSGGTTGSSAASGASSPSPTVTPSASLSPSSAQPTTGDGPAGQPSIARTPGEDITSGPSTRGEVALTFHGQGDDAINRLIREALDQAGARATVFAVGTWVMGDPQQVRAFAADGHEIGNHTWSHLDLPAVSQEAAVVEIRKGQEALEQVLGSAGWWFRPSSTKTSTPTIRAAAAQVGYPRCVSYGVDPEDFRDPGADLVRARVAAAVAAGSIVSLHLGHLGTANALPGILTDLTARGLRAVTLSTLLRD